MKHKTAELQGALLDAAVAKAMGYASAHDVPESICGSDTTGGVEPWMPSSSWDQGGPIIERERLSVVGGEDGAWDAYECEVISSAVLDCDEPGGTGPTPLIAAMRAYVASKLGEVVELP